MIRVFATGRIATDPELVTDKVLKFRFAADRWTRDGKTTTFVTVKVLGDRARALERLIDKGTQLTVFGELVQEEWEGCDGKRSALVVIANDIVLPPGKHEKPTKQDDEWSDEVPF